LLKLILTFSLLFISCKEENLHRFSKGIEPVFYSVKEDSIQNNLTGEILFDSNSCKDCHKTIYENWFNSRHKVALTNELYRESHEREPMEWCVNCHAPLLSRGENPNLPEKRILREEGISCNVCHVRNKKILTSKIPTLTRDQTKYIHDYKVEPSMGKSEFCANCHQFNFPTLKSARTKDNFAYSHLPMQNTVAEFKESYLSNLGECQTCHLASGSADSHSFFGGHDAAKLASSLFLQMERVSQKTILLKVIANGIPHAFPTGDLFRTLKITLRNKKTGSILSEVSLRKEYEDVKTSKDKNSPSMILLADNRIMPPNEGHASEKSFLLPIPEAVEEIEAEISMDYLHGLNRLVTKIPEKFTSLRFKKIYFKLNKSKDSG
jgi:hypothetical protein